MNKIISGSVNESLTAIQSFFEAKSRLIEHVADLIVQCLESDGKILLFGNGGSAADAQHMAAEFVGQFQMEREPLAAIALTTDTSLLTAIGNDFGFDEIFSRQIQALGRKNDIAIGISTSGHSDNVIRAVVEAKALGLVTVGFSGAGGGELGKRVDYDLCVPSEKTTRIQEIHGMLCHIICELVESTLTSGGDS